MRIEFTTNKASNKLTPGMEGVAYKRLRSLEKFLKDDEPLKITIKTYKKGEVKIKASAVLKDNRLVHAECKGVDYYHVLTDLRISLKERIVAKKEKRAKREKTVRVLNKMKEALTNEMLVQREELLKEEA